MMFQVPQFIEIESKILGPLTLKQFLFLSGTLIGGFLLYFIMKFPFFIITMIMIAGIDAAILFVKPYGQPVLKLGANALVYLWRPRYYIWKKELPKEEIPQYKLPKLKPIEKQGESALNLLFLKLQTGAESLEKEGRVKKIPKGPEITEEFEVVRRITGEREAARRVDYR